MKALLLIFFGIMLLLNGCSEVGSPAIAPTNTPAIIKWNTATPSPTVISVTHTPVTHITTTPSWMFVKPHKIGKVRLSEVESPRFIDADNVAYLQEGNLYIYNLATEKLKAISEDNEITSFSWSDIRQQFVVAKKGRLLLLNAFGKTLNDLSAHISTLTTDFDIPKCDLSSVTPSSHTVNLLENVAWADWNPDQQFLIFASDTYDGEYFCVSQLWSFDFTTNRVEQVGSIAGYWPARPQWLKDNTFMIEQYSGGGSSSYNVINISDKTKNFSARTEASVPTNSPDGVRLANISPPFSKLRIWDTSKGGQILSLTFPVISELWDQSYESWSSDGRYLGILHSDVPIEEIESFDWKFSRLRILDVDTKDQWLIPEDFEQIRTRWIPNESKLLVFDWKVDTTTIYLANSTNREITRLGQIAYRRFSPENWSSKKHYLFLIATNKDEEPSFWIWDKNVGGTPFSIGQPISNNEPSSRIVKQIWSPNDKWILIVRSSRYPSTKTVEGVALEAIRVSS